MKPQDITAWALDELSADEKAAIEALPVHHLQALETQAFCSLLSSHLAEDGEAALLPGQRDALKALAIPADLQSVAAPG